MSPAAPLALVLRQPAQAARPDDVDDALALEVAACIRRWAALQAVGLAALTVAVIAALPAAGVLAITAFTALGLAGNACADRAAVREMEELGVAPRLGRALLRTMYRVPEAYDVTTLLPGAWARRKMAHVVMRALDATLD
jgi:hypothetical protein